MTPDDPRHGRGMAGRDAHRKDGEKACRACLDAVARYQRGLEWDLLNGRRRKVSPVGTFRRVTALVAIGWTIPSLAAQIGMDAHHLRTLLSDGGRKYVFASTAAKVSALFDELSMRLPPPSVEATRSRNLAQRKGWAPPLAWDNIDDPDESPADRYSQRRRPQAPGGAFLPPVYEEPDEQVVFRILSGDWRLPCTVWEKRAVVARWTGPHRELESLTGWKVERYTGREELTA